MRGRREYEPLDCDALLDRLREPDRESTGSIEECVDERTLQPVDSFARRRQSLMDNVKMRYVYSAKDRVMHDRDCHLGKRIPDEDFMMAEDLIEGMPICRRCRRRALIRRGVGDDRKYMDAYVRFFRVAGVSTRLLSEIFGQEGVKIRLMDKNSMLFRVKEDTWWVEWEEDGGVLWHNNYTVLADNSRLMTEGFHRQMKYSAGFWSIWNVMIGYSWDEHVRNRIQQRCPMNVCLESEE